MVPSVGHVEDDGGPELTFIEAPSDEEGHRQAVSVRIGAVYRRGRLQEEPGIWVSYQAEYLSSSPLGPVLITPEAWRYLDKEVKRRVRRWRSHRRQLAGFSRIGRAVSRLGYSMQWLP